MSSIFLYPAEPFSACPYLTPYSRALYKVGASEVLLPVLYEGDEVVLPVPI